MDLPVRSDRVRVELDPLVVDVELHATHGSRIDQRRGEILDAEGRAPYPHDVARRCHANAGTPHVLVVAYPGETPLAVPVRRQLRYRRPGVHDQVEVLAHAVIAGRRRDVGTEPADVHGAVVSDGECCRSEAKRHDRLGADDHAAARVGRSEAALEGDHERRALVHRHHGRTVPWRAREERPRELAEREPMRIQPDDRVQVRAMDGVGAYLRHVCTRTASDHRADRRPLSFAGERRCRGRTQRWRRTGRTRCPSRGRRRHRASRHNRGQSVKAAGRCRCWCGRRHHWPGGGRRETALAGRVEGVVDLLGPVDEGAEMVVSQPLDGPGAEAVIPGPRERTHVRPENRHHSTTNPAAAHRRHR